MDLLRIHFNRPTQSLMTWPFTEGFDVSFSVIYQMEGFSDNARIPSSDVVREIREMLDHAQSDPSCGVNLARPSCREACTAFDILHHGRLDPQWPIRIGKWLYRTFFAANNDIQQLVAESLRQAPRGDGPPRLCILVDFTDLAHKFHDLITDLASLPWEALTRDEDIEPLEQTHAVVIARRIYQHRPSASFAYSLHDPTRVLAITPLYDLTGRMRQHEEQARPYNPHSQSHQTPLVWCNCPPIVPGVHIDTLQEYINKHAPHVLHYFGHGIDLRQSREQDGRSVFVLQVDGATSDQPDNLPPGWLRFAVRNEHMVFFAIFACLSGVMLAADGQDQRERSAILALTERIPALLAMSARMPQPMGALAGQVLYARLAQGAELLEAVHAMRSSLWGEGQRVDTPRTQRRAWYVPLLYLGGLSSSVALAKAPALRAQEIAPLLVELQPEATQDHAVQTILDALGHSQHALIQGAHGTCRTALLIKLHARLVKQCEQTGGQIVLLSPRTALSSADAAAVKRTVRASIAAALAQSRGEHVHWLNIADDLAFYLSQPGTTSAPIYLLIDDIDDCDPGLAQQLLASANMTLRCVLVVNNLDIAAAPHIRMMETDEFRPPPSPDVMYDWYLDSLNNAAGWPKLRILHLLLEVDMPLKREEIQQILGYHAVEELNSHLRSLASQELNYAVQDGGTITTRIDPKTWRNHQEREKVIKDVIHNLQQWCESQWALVRNGNRSKRLPKTMLAMLAHPRLRANLQPVPNEPIDEDNLTFAYKPWLALLGHARYYEDTKLIEQVCELILWRATEGPNAAAFTALDHWVLQGMVLAVRDPEAAAEIDETTLEIDAASVERRLSIDMPASQAAIIQELRESVWQFWEKDVLKLL